MSTFSYSFHLLDSPDQGQVIPIYDMASTSLARQAVREKGKILKFDPTTIEKIAIIVSEMATNQIKHAKKGKIYLRPIHRQGIPGLEMVAYDEGPGMVNPRMAWQKNLFNLEAKDSLGAGFQAIYNLSDEIDIDIRIGEGTCIRSRKFSQKKDWPNFEVAIMGRPYPGEAISGDMAFIHHDHEGLLGALCDGAGHGILAREASQKIIEIISSHKNLDLESILRICHEQTSPSRGGTLGLIKIFREMGLIEYAGLGDITLNFCHQSQSKVMNFSHGLLGYEISPSILKNVKVQRLSITPGDVLLLYSDGLRTQTTLNHDLNIQRRPAILIAQHVLELYGRDNDDALVLVVRFGNRLK